MPAKKKIYIVDDHPLMRKGMAMTLENSVEFEVCGQSESAEEALGEIPRLKPDGCVIDISLPGMNGIELVKNLLAQMPDLKILMVSRHDEELYAERAIRAGAKGYLMKLEAGEVLVSAVRQVMNGSIYLSDKIGSQLIMKIASGQSAGENPLELLSDRELEVFELTGKGESTKEIARRLHVSVKTVDTYRARIKEKMHLKTANELMRKAVQWVEGGSV
ncbi:DNA-binding response regulator [Rhodohalobacter sp. SW132]|uniref:response regulator transcription factor n=1 Tax=Rhodohalobacter sp. SW132 TaxID=2293433 RepID=UPI000E241AB0|nr:response regulator transcription factor [Rhodohalobacter sp. SW132]REL33206.1 DNA-binding response regulator [Rhodohalobacter sp. SW132]